MTTTNPPTRAYAACTRLAAAWKAADAAAVLTKTAAQATAIALIEIYAAVEEKEAAYAAAADDAAAYAAADAADYADRQAL